MAMGGPRVAAVLFDLDGTLVDSAPDLAGTANQMRALRGLPAMPYAQLRPHCGSGARGMLLAGFERLPGQPGYDSLRAEFLGLYAERMLDHTRVFDAVHALLETLDAQKLPWGIVTNKSLSLATPLAHALGLLQRAAVLVAGDSTPHTKPHPEPLLEAARRMGLAPATCAYVGDDARDVHAGRAAGMATLAAAWGYLGPGADVCEWGADAVLEQPGRLLQWLELP